MKYEGKETFFTNCLLPDDGEVRWQGAA